MARYPGAGRRLPRHRAAGRAGRRLCRPPKNFIDELVFKKLKAAGPAAVGRVRRRARSSAASRIDIAGRLPTPDEVEAFLADTDADKRDKLVDRLLDSTDYADYFANKWSAILRNRRQGRQRGPAPTFAFHDWIRDSLHENKPYDQFVREVLTATGEAVKNPPVVWYREVQGPDGPGGRHGPVVPRPADRSAPAATTIRSRSGASTTTTASRRSSRRSAVKTRAAKAQPRRASRQAREPFTVSHKAGTAKAVNPKTSKPVPPRGLDGPAARRSRPTTTRAASWSTGWSSQGQPVLRPRRWSTATGSTSSAAAWSIRRTTCA